MWTLGAVAAALENPSVGTLNPEAGAEDSYPEPYTLVWDNWL